MRRNQIIMGTGVSLDIEACADEKLFAEVFKLLSAIDKRFSSYQETSELSRYQRGEITKSGLSPQMLQVMKACARYERLTDGYFSANYAGRFDPTGYVKGWAIELAAELIESKGYKTFCIGIGGDILAGSDSTKVWRIGLQDPKNPKQIFNQLNVSNSAVATSGNYERGAHIINPKTKLAAKELLSITVVGPSIISADVFATAGFAMAKKAVAFIETQKDYECLIMANDGGITMSSGFSKLL